MASSANEILCNRRKCLYIMFCVYELIFFFMGSLVADCEPYARVHAGID